MKHTIVLAFCVSVATAFAIADEAAPRRPAPVPRTKWQEPKASEIPSPHIPDPAELSRLLILMKSDDPEVRFPAAARWMKEAIGPWPLVLSMEKYALRDGKDAATRFFPYASGILDWKDLPIEVRRTMLDFALTEITRPERAPGRIFRTIDGHLCLSSPDWERSEARREAAILSLGKDVRPHGSYGWCGRWTEVSYAGPEHDWRIQVIQKWDTAMPYDRIHRSLASFREDPIASMPDAGRDQEEVRIADAAEHLARDIFSHRHGGGEPVPDFFRRKGIEPEEGFKILKSVLEETDRNPSWKSIRGNAILSLPFADVPESFDYALLLAETGPSSDAWDALTAAVRLAKGDTNRLSRVRALQVRLQVNGVENVDL